MPTTSGLDGLVAFLASGVNLGLFVVAFVAVGLALRKVWTAIRRG